jgi:quercetin dioxygenase-like cupin family protein
MPPSARIDAVEDGIAKSKLEQETPERFVPLRRQLGVTSFGLNQIVLASGERGRIHRHHHQEEVYLVLEGQLTLLVEREPHELSAGAS